MQASEVFQKGLYTIRVMLNSRKGIGLCFSVILNVMVRLCQEIKSNNNGGIEGS